MFISIAAIHSNQGKSMAQLTSVLPGRIRLEAPVLIGRLHLCREFERRISATNGILEVVANQRTGRILVRFDERSLDRFKLTEQLEETLTVCKAQPEQMLLYNQEPSRGNGGSESSKLLSGPVLLDFFAHMLLPKPFDFIIPTAVASIWK
jgi:hypothetical protein